ncbi:flagellar basal body P-ring formation chaperone FlgA [Phenylobacterium sp.]|uniref:flagellar basal body P-ring formation chaperone FlgA n=1 Tax=Phenylobacterium sp. TaxID=1871053 RepID=UPI002B6B423E|nr:flagellar basal body P-ring formation chaperone FlgA [Phenylobacterium sp.]HLZ73683.1 flagellar basal body P-ring formation chaperone FlgA [Phenylobacterium sp.]
MRGFVSFIAVLAFAGPALAGSAVSLKADAASADSVVTLGDLFDGAGPAGRVAVATRTGQTVVLDAATVQAAARRAGLDWANAEGLHRIVVHAGAPSAAAGGSPAVSAARGNTEVLTYTRSLGAGEIVQPTDLAWTKAVGAPGDAPSDADQVIGQMAKRPLRAGAVVLAHDVAAAIVIKAGDLISVKYDSDGVSLTLEGKAMASAGIGETLAVMNTQSKKIVQAVVSGPGQAVVGPGADQMKSARSLRYAAR